MRLRILQLEDELAAKETPTKRQKTNAGTARASTSTVAPSTTENAPPTAAQQKADDKKMKLQVKKLFDRLKKECKSADVKFQGSPKTVKFDEVFERAEFEALFKTGEGGHGLGRLVQPTPTNKPTSTVTIIDYSGASATAFFSDAGANMSQLKGVQWSIGGGPYFAKSNKIGACDVAIDHLEVQYSRNTMKCTLKFVVSEEGTDGGVYGVSHSKMGGRFGGGRMGMFF
ncbi:hypothetical protein OF83DRAFT_1137120 [Amylostereum chailletii]|nr:hypothetical protein OF83DRAFT_1137120 [Amylostereum chailletii]